MIYQVFFRIRKIANEILFKDNFKILDEHVNIYFKVDYH